MKNDNKKLKLMVMTMLLVVVGVILFGAMAIRKGEINLQNILWMGVVFLVLVFSMIIFIYRYKDLKKGIPLEDERSRKVVTMASSKSFMVTLYWLLAIATFEKFFAGLVGLEQLDAGQTVGGGILGMAVAFISFWFYYNRKANI